MKGKPLVWLSVLRKASVSARGHENGFLNKAKLLPRAAWAKKRGAAKAPYGSHRFNLSAEAARLFPTYLGRPTGFDPQPL
jgi:hypothetical protein